MTKVNPNNENERKSGIFPGSILKSNFIYFLSKNKIFKIKIPQSYD